jgi:hypothetical protein
MSHQLISRSADLKRLRDEGYDINIKSGHLLVRDVPYLDSKQEIKLGEIVTKLVLAGDVTAEPDDHTIYFVGAYPCYKDGSEIAQFRHSSKDLTLAENLVVNHRFSAKPIETGKYRDYYDKVTTYVAMLSGPVHASGATISARIYPAIAADAEDSVFNYVDTASSRAEIVVATNKLGLDCVAIIGLGGTGSYVLDFVTKTPVKQIHLFDGDIFSQHNAFRSPSAASLDVLREAPKKVEYFKGVYSNMHRGIVAHPFYISPDNVGQLQSMKFVFVCTDRGELKKEILQKLQQWKIPFADVGMGVQLVDNSLLGVLRVTASSERMCGHIWEKSRIPFSDDDDNNEYDRSIQVADLNALNAALAVIKWKKMFGFYMDLEHEHHSTYTIDGNMLLNSDNG